MIEDGPDLKGGKAGTGYRRAPRASQYNKGQSGNPAGRPKGIVARKHRPVSDRLNALMLGEAYRPVKVNENGKEITMPLAQAVFRSLGAAALKGETRAQAMFINILSVSEEVKALADAQAHADAENAEEARIEITIVEPDGRRTPYRTDGSSEPK